MAVKVLRKSDGEVIVCRGCKGHRWVVIQENAKTFNKYVCEKCWNEHTLYTDPAQYKHSVI